MDCVVIMLSTLLSTILQTVLISVGLPTVDWLSKFIVISLLLLSIGVIVLILPFCWAFCGLLMSILSGEIENYNFRIYKFFDMI